MKKQQTNARTGQAAVARALPTSLVSILIAQAKRDEDLIREIAVAVRNQDKDAVFRLAQKLTKA